MAAEADAPLGKSTQDALRMLDGCLIFSALDVGARRRLAEHAHQCRFAAGETIFQSGSPGHAMMAVVKGTVRITARSQRGTEIVLAELAPGEIVGEIAIFDGGDRTADAVALTNCELVALERRDVLPFLQQHPEVCLKLLQVLSTRLRRTDEWITEIALAHISVRLAKVLLRLTASRDRRGESNRGSRIALSQRELASMIGASRERVNRCLQQWQRQGMVAIKKRSITLVDPKAIREIAEFG